MKSLNSLVKALMLVLSFYFIFWGYFAGDYAGLMTLFSRIGFWDSYALLYFPLTEAKIGKLCASTSLFGVF